MVTQPGREQLVLESVKCFVSQTYCPRELVILHTGIDSILPYIGKLCLPESTAIRVYNADPQLKLGTLRNRALSECRFPYFCQWDDDDWSLPLRLECQFEQLGSTQADFCFFTDQLHLFRQRALLTWDDWSREPFPGCLIDGSIMGRVALMPRYPDLARGEDTPLVHQLVDSGARITPLSGQGQLLIYTYHGSNTWEFEHHLAIAVHKNLDAVEIEERMPVIVDALRKVPVNLNQVRIPTLDGYVTVDIHG